MGHKKITVYKIDKQFTFFLYLKDKLLIIMQSPRSPSISPLRDDIEYKIDLEEINKHEDRQRTKKNKKKKTATPEREKTPPRSPIREKSPAREPSPQNYFSEYQQEEEVKDENKIVYRISNFIL